MRYLIDDVSSGNIVESIYRDTAAVPGMVKDALITQHRNVASLMKLRAVAGTTAGR